MSTHVISTSTCVLILLFLRYFSSFFYSNTRPSPSYQESGPLILLFIPPFFLKWRTRASPSPSYQESGPLILLLFMPPFFLNSVPGPPTRIKSLDPSSTNSSLPVTVSPMQAPSMTVTQRPVGASSKRTIDVLL
jgi:hypothetical protein